MRPEDIMKLNEENSFNSVICFGKYCLFTPRRIDRGSVPPGLYVYDIRHGSKGDRTEPVEILPHVTCNYMGSIVSNEPFPIDFKDFYINMDRDAGDFDYTEWLDGELWDDDENIPNDINEYIDYPNETKWDVPTDRLTPREKEKSDEGAP